MTAYETKNLLLLDDDDIRISPFKDFLKEVGFTVHHKQSPKDAWKSLQNEDIHFHIIVMDLIIPTGGAYSRKICPSPEKCGEIFLKDLRDLNFRNEVLSEDESKIRKAAKQKYKGIPVVVFTARNIEELNLSKKLTGRPYKALRVDSKRIFDFEKYAQELLGLVK